MRIHQSLFYSIILILLFSCQAPEKKFKRVSLERWAVSGDAKSYEKDSISFLETKQYNTDGLLEGHLFYTNSKKLNAKEIRIFEAPSIGPKGSQYKDSNDNILSYYTFTTNENGLVTESKAYDASNDQLLRIEAFDYKGKFLQKKEVRNATGVPMRIFQYTTDEHGNDQQVQVLQPNGDEILTEIFRITKYDEYKNWTEKWGFVNDKPFSYVARKIEYQ